MHWPRKCMKGVHISLEAFLIGEQMKPIRFKFGDDALTKVSGITKSCLLLSVIYLTVIHEIPPNLCQHM